MYHNKKKQKKVIYTTHHELCIHHDSVIKIKTVIFMEKMKNKSKTTVYNINGRILRQYMNN